MFEVLATICQKNTAFRTFGQGVALPKLPKFLLKFACRKFNNMMTSPGKCDLHGKNTSAFFEKVEKDNVFLKTQLPGKYNIFEILHFAHYMLELLQRRVEEKTQKRLETTNHENCEKRENDQKGPTTKTAKRKQETTKNSRVVLGKDPRAELV